MWMLLLSDPSALTEITNFGAAGMMGAMWLWERRTSRQREQQLDEAHERILGDRIQLDQLIDVVRGNAEALSRLTVTQEQLILRLDREGERGEAS